MHFFYLGLFLAAFQVTCHGAPKHPADVSEKGKHREKRSSLLPPPPDPELPPPPAPELDESDCLPAHNAKRALHQDTPELEWDATLAQSAKDMADNIAATNLFLPGEGENLFRAADGDATCAEAVEMWYSEIKDYNYNNPPTTPSEFTANFTQLVWKETTRVGVARSGKFLVAQYFPPGNLMGKFAENVMPLETDIIN